MAQDIINIACQGIDIIKLVIKEWKDFSSSGDKYETLRIKISEFEKHVACMELAYTLIKEAYNDIIKRTESNNPSSLICLRSYLVSVVDNVEQSLLSVHKILNATNEKMIIEKSKGGKNVIKTSQPRISEFIRHVAKKIFASSKDDLSVIFGMIDDIDKCVSKAELIIQGAQIAQITSSLGTLFKQEETFIDKKNDEDEQKLLKKVDTEYEELKELVVKLGSDDVKKAEGQMLLMARVNSALESAEQNSSTMANILHGIDMMRATEHENHKIMVEMSKKLSSARGTSKINIGGWLQPYSRIVGKVKVWMMFLVITSLVICFDVAINWFIWSYKDVICNEKSCNTWVKTSCITEWGIVLLVFTYIMLGEISMKSGVIMDIISPILNARSYFLFVVTCFASIILKCAIRNDYQYDFWRLGLSISACALYPLVIIPHSIKYSMHLKEKYGM